MAWSHEIVGDSAVFTVEGQYTLDEAMAAYVDLLEDSRLRPRMPLLVDGTRAIAKPSVREMLTAAEFAASREHQFEKIAVAVSTSLQYGLTRMFAIYAELHAGLDVRVFKSVEAAREWIAEGG